LSLTEIRQPNSTGDQSRGPGQHGSADYDAVDGERSEAPLADPVHEPGYGGVGDDKGDDEADRKDDPRVRREIGGASPPTFYDLS
jgi:hypothetical protein